MSETEIRALQAICFAPAVFFFVFIMAVLIGMDNHEKQFGPTDLSKRRRTRRDKRQPWEERDEE